MKRIATRALVVSMLLVVAVVLEGSVGAGAFCGHYSKELPVSNIEDVTPEPSTNRLVIYTSLRVAPMRLLTQAFMKAHPEIQVVFQSANGVKIIEKFEAERKAGHVYADILWTNEVTEFYRLKKEGMLLPYVSPQVADIDTHLKDFDGSFTPVRLSVAGIIYNTRLVKERPATWAELTEQGMRDGVELPNPNMCCSARMAMSLLAEEFGENYFAAVTANGARLGKDCGEAVESIANGESLATIGLDDLAYDAMRRGASIGIAYPPELPVLPSPVAILAGSRNVRSAQLFVDFLLSEEGQTLLAERGTIPVRRGIPVPAELGMPSVPDVMHRAIRTEYASLDTLNGSRRFLQHMPVIRHN